VNGLPFQPLSSCFFFLQEFISFFDGFFHHFVVGLAGIICGRKGVDCAGNKKAQEGDGDPFHRFHERLLFVSVPLRFVFPQIGQPNQGLRIQGAIPMGVK
jgi:hypothetical protein